MYRPPLWEGVLGVRCRNLCGNTLWPEGSESYTLSFNPLQPSMVCVDGLTFVYINNVERLVNIGNGQQQWI